MLMDRVGSGLPWTKLVLSVLLCGVLVALGATPGSGEGSNGLGPRTLVGAWFVDVTPTLVPPFVSLGTFNSDGTLTSISAPSLGFPPESPGYGVWVRVRAHTFASTFHTLVGDGAGNLGGHTEGACDRDSRSEWRRLQWSVPG